MAQLTGTVAVVIGASKGIGGAIEKGLAATGAAVVFLASPDAAWVEKAFGSLVASDKSRTTA